MDLQDIQLAKLNLIYKLKDIMNTNGFAVGSYSVEAQYPYNSTTNPNFPLIAVEVGPVVSKPIQLGSDNIKRCLFFIDVLAKTDSQRDDISDLIFDALDNYNLPFYDFNTGIPTAIGVYTGITQRGNIILGNVMMENIYPPINEQRNIYKHHKTIQVPGNLEIN